MSPLVWEGELAKEVNFTLLISFFFLHFGIRCLFKQSPFYMFSDLLFAPFCESYLFVFEKAENMMTYVSIHTIQLILLIQIATIFAPIFVLGFA